MNFGVERHLVVMHVSTHCFAVSWRVSGQVWLFDRFGDVVAEQIEYLCVKMYRGSSQ